VARQACSQHLDDEYAHVCRQLTLDRASDPSGVRQVRGCDISGAADAYVLLGGIRFRPAFEAFLTNRGIVPSLVAKSCHLSGAVSSAITGRADGIRTAG